MGRLNPLGNQTVTYIRMLASAHLGRLAEAHRRRDAGASAIELAIITAILVLLAVGVVAVIHVVVTNNCNNINNNSGGTGGGTCP
jgi:Flp pilus assembly pilin Flp